MKPRHYLDIALYRTFAELKTEVSKSYLGVAWWILDPMLYGGVLYLVFGVLEIRNRPPEFVAFLLIGIVHFRWFQRGVVGGSRSLISNSGLMQTVYLPKWQFPIPNILSDLVKHSIVLVPLFLFLQVMDYPLTSAYVALPGLMVIQLALIYGVSLVLTAVMPLLPDLRFLLENLLTLLFFVSGIFFSGDQVPEDVRYIFYLNPMAGMIESYREIMLHGDFPRAELIWWIPLLALLLLGVGFGLLNRFDRHYPKLVIDK